MEIVKYLMKHGAQIDIQTYVIHPCYSNLFYVRLITGY